MFSGPFLYVSHGARRGERHDPEHHVHRDPDVPAGGHHGRRPRRLVGRIDSADLSGAANDAPAPRLMEPATARFFHAGRERAGSLATETDRDEIPVVDGRNRPPEGHLPGDHRRPAPEHLADALLGAGGQPTGLRRADLAGDRARGRAPRCSSPAPSRPSSPRSSRSSSCYVDPHSAAVRWRVLQDVISSLIYFAFAL